MVDTPLNYAPSYIVEMLNQLNTSLHAEYLHQNNTVRLTDPYEGTLIEATPTCIAGEWNIHVWQVSPPIYNSKETDTATAALAEHIRDNGHPDGQLFHLASLVYQSSNPKPDITYTLPPILPSPHSVKTLNINDTIDAILDTAAGRSWEEDDGFWILRSLKRVYLLKIA
jgi:hypothetical protein